MSTSPWPRFLDRIISDGSELHSIIVTHRGREVVRGFGSPWQADDLQLVYSLSKTFCSAAVGLAVSDGAFGYDDVVVDIFPDQVDDRVGPKARTIRVRDLLAMASGHTSETLERVVAETGGVLTRDSIGAFLRIEPDGTPGETFAYNQPCTWTLSRIVAERTGSDVHQLIRDRVLSRLGVEQSVWARDADGLPLGFSGFHVTPDTISRFFTLLAAGGRHGEDQLLAREWVDEFSHRWVETSRPREQVSSDWGLGYGWQVWMCQHGFRGDGAFGQYGVIVPDHDLVVAITSWTPVMQTVLTALWEEVLPHLDGDDTDEGELDERLDTLEAFPAPAPAEPFGWEGSVEQVPFVLGGSGDAWTLRWDLLDQPVAVGLGRWLRTTLRWEDRSLEVAGRLVAHPEGEQVVLAVVNTPHTLRIDLPSGTASWVPELMRPTTLSGLAQTFTR